MHDLFNLHGLVNLPSSVEDSELEIESDQENLEVEIVWGFL